MEILEQARKIDPNYVVFGASMHKYKLNPIVSGEYVHEIEKKYGFTLPEDYFRFITEIGDGGAGPDYGIMPFVNFLIKDGNPLAEEFKNSYRYSLGKSFKPWPMKLEEVEEYAITTKEGYKENPDKYFIYHKYDNDLSDSDGFFIFGSRGCQWEFGIITAGERKGQVFDTDNEGAYCLLANSFDEFYQNWLNKLLDKEQFRKTMEMWRKIVERKG